MALSVNRVASVEGPENRSSDIVHDLLQIFHVFESVLPRESSKRRLLIIAHLAKRLLKYSLFCALELRGYDLKGLHVFSSIHSRVGLTQKLIPLDFCKKKWAYFPICQIRPPAVGMISYDKESYRKLDASLRN